MYRLLIVDDEPNIADGLYIFFRNVEHIDLDVYKAYSGFEALEILNRIKIDIVLADICMPGLTGLQLLDKIRIDWPQCRVVFLTGYDEFDYIYKAVKYDGVSYLLKTEGYDEIIKAVRNVITQIDSSLKTDELIDKARKYMTTAIPLMQKEYLTDLLNGDSVVNGSRKQQFKELEIPLNSDLPVLLLLGRFNLPTGISSVQRMEFYCSVKLIAEQNFPAVLTAVHIASERNILVWFIQPKKFIEDGAENEAAAYPWQHLVSLVNGSIDNIQSICMNSLDTSISFILDNEGTGWDNISGKYDSLKLHIYSHAGAGRDMLILNRGLNGSSDSGSGKMKFKKIKMLESCMESGQQKEFLQLLSEARQCFGGADKHYGPALELFYSISLMFLSYINRLDISEKISFKTELNKLTYADEHASWDDAFDYFNELALDIFALMDSEQERNAAASIHYIKQYINNHLNEDLSLARLAEKVYFNASYFSRMFKQSTGINVLSYINDVRISKAKELLRNNSLKIHEIAAAVGYDSPSYFTQFFKRLINISPQEYRDIVSKGKEI